MNQEEINKSSAVQNNEHSEEQRRDEYAQKPRRRPYRDYEYMGGHDSGYRGYERYPYGYVRPQGMYGEPRGYYGDRPYRGEGMHRMPYRPHKRERMMMRGMGDRGMIDREREMADRSVDRERSMGDRSMAERERGHGMEYGMERDRMMERERGMPERSMDREYGYYMDRYGAGPGLYRRERRRGIPVNPAPNRVLGIFGLPEAITAEEMKRIVMERLQNEVEVEDIQLVPRKIGRKRGFGFVYFATIEDAEKAKKKLEGLKYEDNEVRVDFSITARGHAREEEKQEEGAYN